MHTIIHPLKPAPSRTAENPNHFRNPHYDCLQSDDTMKLVVYVPGVDAAGVEISLRGTDLVVTARKAHFVRVNWQAAHLESAQRDYRLRLRIGNGFDADGLNAEISEGVLSLTLPKRLHASDTTRSAHRRVA